MNYRHAFHAGNFADVMKHALFLRVLIHLAAKTAPFRVIDTHAGRGRYNLAGEQASRTNEWRDGIGRLAGASMPPAIADILSPYLDQVLPLLAGERPNYPGSPALALAIARPQDRLVFVEKHPEDVRNLRAATAPDRRVNVLEMDGWMALNAQVPPSEKRGLVLIDPPFEEPGEFTRMAAALAAAHRKWATGSYLLWYPVKDNGAVEEFMEALRDTGIRKILRMELLVDRPDALGPLAGSGLIAVNPPWTLKAEAEALLPWLAQRLARSSNRSSRVEWVAPE